MIINPSSIKGEYTKNFTSGLFVAHTTTYNYIESQCILTVYVLLACSSSEVFAAANFVSRRCQTLSTLEARSKQHSLLHCRSLVVPKSWKQPRKVPGFCNLHLITRKSLLHLKLVYVLLHPLHAELMLLLIQETDFLKKNLDKILPLF